MKGWNRQAGRLPVAALLLPLVLICALAWAEPPNPFDGGGEPPPPPPPPPPADFGFNENDNGGGDPGFGFGGEPPPPPPVFNDPGIDPTPPRPAFNGAGGGTTGKTTAPPPSLFKENAKRTAKGRQPKLADYLELDPAIRSLEVKNFDLPDKDIKDVVTLISKWTGKNFILDNKVRGKITIIGPSQVTLQEAYHAFLSALEANNLTTVQSGKFIRIIEAAEARRAPVETYAGEFAPDTDQYITRIFQLKHINADEVQREFRDMTSRQGKLFAYEPTNSIIITDTGSNIRRIEGILKTLDVKNFETTLHVLKIRNGNAKTIADMLAEIYGDGRSGRVGAAGATAGPRVFRRNALDRLRGGGVISKVIPDESTNSLIVLANQAGFRQLVELVAKLDVRVTDTGKIHVYYCEYAKAEDLASTLASLASGGGAGITRQGGNRRTTVTGPNAAGGQAVPAGGGGPVTAELEGGVKITSDPATNALVITANPQDYQTLRRVIKKLDIPRLQVFVESAILELTIDHSNKFGANIGVAVPDFGLAGGFITDPTALTNILTKTGLPEGVTVPLFFGSAVNTPIGIPNPTGGAPVSQNVALSTFTGLLNLLARDTNTSVLSTPQILAMDNEKAEFKVQDETPVQSTFNVIPGVGAAAGGLAGFAQGNVERLKTGIEIKLTPHINAASKTIRLELEQKVDSIRASNDVPQALANVQRATTSRVTNTTVVVRDGDYIMLGGLMSDQVDDKVTKVPLLGDIPILGWLFKSKSSTTVKKNLIILLKPRILGTTYEAAKVTELYLDKRQDFVDRHFGGGDEHEEQVTELRESLLEQRRRGAQDRGFDYRNNDEEVSPEASLQRPIETELDGPRAAPSASRKAATRGNASSGSARPASPGPDTSGSLYDNAATVPADTSQPLPEPSGLD
jgi:general secretion pathway protein D